MGIDTYWSHYSKATFYDFGWIAVLLFERYFHSRFESTVKCPKNSVPQKHKTLKGHIVVLAQGSPKSNLQYSDDSF